MAIEPTNTINVLSRETVSRIAAGELIERPCSVVKELIENSIDAESTVIMVDVMDGGKRLIRVSDNGVGIPPEDVRVAFERHATSKLRTVDDLWHVRTMGFRGEALPSIAAVSNVTIRTACVEQKTGVLLTLMNGIPGELQESVLASGTIVEAENIFCNAPVRRKFLKTTATEFGHICRTVQNQCLGHPAVHFKLTHNGKRVSDFPAMSRMHDRVLQIFGTAVVNRCVEISKTFDGIAVWGMFARPEYVKTSRVPQEIILNGRWIKNAVIVRAIYEAYRMRIPNDHHPTFVISLDVDPKLVDVNVHPTKREIRFLDQATVRHAVFHAVKSGLGLVRGDSQTVASIASLLPAGYNRDRSDEPTGIAAQTAQGVSYTAAEVTDNAGASSVVVAESISKVWGRDASPMEMNIDACAIKPLGQLNQTYVVASVDIGTWRGLKVVDQHTAHESVLFDRLVEQAKTRFVATQSLLFSPVVELQPQHAVVLNQHLDALRASGLEIERFGKRAFRLCAVPSFLTHADAHALLGDVAEEMLDETRYEGSGQSDMVDAKTHKVFATMACHGAIKANQTLGFDEIRRLMHEWITIGMPTTCPHGRRIVMRLSIAELDRIFKRA